MFVCVSFAGPEVTLDNFLYVVKEDDGFVNLTVSLDQPSCVDVTVVVVSQEQSPVDASSENMLLFVGHDVSLYFMIVYGNHSMVH